MGLSLLSDLKSLDGRRGGRNVPWLPAGNLTFSRTHSDNCRRGAFVDSLRNYSVRFFPVIGRTIAHYRILEKLGSGGMGVVYKAEDTRLHRFVALKFQPQEFAKTPQAIARFQREAQAASALNHPNICTIYDVGEHEGHPYIVMEYLDGVTLRYKIGGRPLELEETLRYAIEIVDALDVAHSAGIIHRDIKTANVLITKRGQAKVLDFGLAKLMADVQSGGPNDPTMAVNVLTTAGDTLGTVAYMSPEQIEGKPLDGRTDVFSFGIVLYEMATGRSPFEKQTKGATFGAILHEQAILPRALNAGTPARLEEIIEKTLEKKRDLRYQHASEIRADLQRLKRDLESGRVSSQTHASSGSLSGIARLSTGSGTESQLQPAKMWRLDRGNSIVASIVLVAVVAGAVALWRIRTNPKLVAKDTIVLADFSNTTGEVIFDDTLRQALSAQLSQSPFLTVLPDRRVAAILKQMQKTPQEHLTQATAREVCLRSGSQALLAGSISNAGDRYVLKLRAIGCQTEQMLASAQAEARTRDGVLSALGEAGGRLRAGLGESLASVARYNKPLSDASTSSLGAWQAFTEGLIAARTKGDADAIPYVKHAIELDPNFARAYTTLGAFYENLGELDHAREQYSKAFELRERVSDVERFVIEVNYYGTVTGDQEKAVQTYQRWIEEYPNNSLAHVNLSMTYAVLGRFEKAAAESREALRIKPDDVIAYGNLISEYTTLEKYDEARSVYDEAQSRKLDGSYLHQYMYLLAFLQGDEAAMQEHSAWAMGKPGAEDAMLSAMSDSEAYAGHLAKATELSERAVQSARQNDEQETAAIWQLNAAWREAEFGNAATAPGMVKAATKLSNSRNVRMWAAFVLARAGEADQALAMADALSREAPEDTILLGYWVPSIRAAAELDRGQGTQAIETLRPALVYELSQTAPFLPAYLRAQAYLQAKEPQLASGEFQKVIEHPGVVLNNPIAVFARLGLARAKTALGDTIGAREAYQDFLALWKNGDANIPVLKKAQSEYAKLR